MRTIKILMYYVIALCTVNAIYAQTQVNYMAPIMDGQGRLIGFQQQQKPVAAVTTLINQITLNSGWYQVLGTGATTMSNKDIAINGDVHLILRDHPTPKSSSDPLIYPTATLELWGKYTGRIVIPSGSSLTIYSESLDPNYMGCVVTDGEIGGAGNLVINGGYIKATIGSQNMYHIGQSGLHGGNIVINGGIIGANGCDAGEGINVDNGSLVINGGIVIVANGYNGKANISGQITRVNGGMLKAIVGGAPYNIEGTLEMDGNAVVFTDSVSDTSNKTKGILFIDDKGKTYGDVTFASDLEIPTGKTLVVSNGTSLTIPAGATLSNDGSVVPVDGSTIHIVGSLVGNKIVGANVSGAPIAHSKTHNTITVNKVNLAAVTGQAIEYGIATSNNITTATWQSDTVFTGLASDATYYIFARSKDNSHFATGTASNAVTIKTIIKENTPTAVIDYINETLTGLVPNVTYSFNNNANISSSAAGTYSIAEAWMTGAAITIVKKGDGVTYLDSDPQNCIIPARPAKPAGIAGINETAYGMNDGQITGVSAALEYSANNGASWTVCTTTAIIGLAPGNYKVRYKAVAGNSFYGRAADIAIGEGITIIADYSDDSLKATLSYFMDDEIIITFPEQMTSTAGMVKINGHSVANGDWQNDSVFVVTYKMAYNTDYTVVISGFNAFGSHTRYEQTFTFKTEPLYTTPIPTINRKVELQIPAGIVSEPPPGVYYVPSGQNFTFTLNTSADKELLVYTNRLIDGEREQLTGVKDLYRYNSCSYLMREIRQSVVITVDAIASNDALANNVAVWARGSRLYVRVDKPEMIEVYTSAGALCLQRIAGNDMSIPLPRGIYIVKLGDKRYKVALN